MVNSFFCTSCGCRSDAGTAFCENCGERVEDVHKTDDVVTRGANNTAEFTAAPPAVLPLHRTRTAIGTWVAPFNASILFGGTVISIFDFLSPRIVLLPAAAIATVGALLLIILLRKYVAPNLDRGSKVRRVLEPDVVFHKSPLLIAATVMSMLMMTGAAWSGAASATGGVMASSFDMVRGAQMQLGILHGMQKEQRVQTAVLVDIRDGLQVQSAAAGVVAKSADKKTSAILDDTGVIRNAVTRELTPFEALAAQGYGATKEDLCAALIAGNTKAIDLLLKMGFNDNSLVMVIGSNELHCLESVFLNIEARVKLRTMAAQLPLNVEQLNKYYTPLRVDDKSRMIDSPGLLTELGINTNINKDTLFFTNMEVTPLLLCVWGNNVEAADLLLKLGVNKNNGGRMKISHLNVRASKMINYSVILSPLSEAKRLGRIELVALLIKYSAKEGSSKTLIEK